MAEPESALGAELQANLHRAADMLRAPHALGPGVQQALAELVGELEHALQTGTVPSAELTHLRDTSAHLVEALRHQGDERKLSATRDRLIDALAKVEAQAPFTVGIVRRILDALANIGI